MALSGKIRESDKIGQSNLSNRKAVLELIKEDLTIDSDKQIGSLGGRRSSQGDIKQIEGNETINLNEPIGSLEGRRQLS